MHHSLTREELYNLVWSEPMQKLAPRFGISGVALSKTCRRADIPVPERGYWARLQAGKIVVKRPLPPRSLGMPNVVTVGERPYETHAQLVSRLLSDPIPAPPTFPEDLSYVTEIVVELLVRGEANYRAGALAAHEWLIERRAEFEEEARRRKEEDERQGRERLAKLERERVDRLLTEADNWRRAADLRAFVKAVRVAARANDPATTDRLENWATSVLALADRIDPVRAGRIPGPQSDWTPCGAPNTKAPPSQNDSP